jgi:hypothetical protein
MRLGHRLLEEDQHPPAATLAQQLRQLRAPGPEKIPAENHPVPEIQGYFEFVGRHRSHRLTPSLPGGYAFLRTK